MRRLMTLKMLQQSTLLSGIIIFMSACGSFNGPIASDSKVTNGKSIPEDQFKSVVLIAMFHGEDQSICTGTFVNDHQLITAGHCVDGLDESSPRLAYVKVVSDGSGKQTYKAAARALKYTRNPEYSMTDEGGVNGNDLSVVEFPANTAPSTSFVAKSSPNLKDDLTIVGYGNNKTFLSADGQLSGDGAGSKRFGTNKVYSKQDGMISFIGFPEETEGLELGELVSSGSGDSGGPMFVNDLLVGVTSGGGLAKLKNSDDYVGVSHYVDLNSDVSKAFLAKLIKRSSFK